MGKDVNYYMDLPYTIVLKKDKDNQGENHYYARILEFPCLGDGDTPKEAVDCLFEHMRVAIEAYLKDDIQIPEPQIKYSGNILIRVDPELHADLAQEAAAHDMSLNKYTSLILERRKIIAEPRKKKEVAAK